MVLVAYSLYSVGGAQEGTELEDMGLVKGRGLRAV